MAPKKRKDETFSHEEQLYIIKQFHLGFGPTDEFVFVEAATGGDIYSAKHGTIQNIMVYEKL